MLDTILQIFEWMNPCQLFAKLLNKIHAHVIIHISYKDKTAIAKVEAGKVDLPQSKISTFVKALNTTTSYLFSDEIDKEPTTISTQFNGNEYTEDEMNKIKEFAAFVKASRT